MVAPTRLLAQSLDEATPAAEERAVVQQVSHPVRPKSQITADYPADLRANLAEGWVQLNFMVSSAGKPYEIYVCQSVGSREFQQAAIRAIEHASFEPASVNGKPIESATSIKVKFYLNGGQKGARPEFIDSYRTFEKAIDRRDKVSADAVLAKLPVSNPYEDAYAGVAEYQYALYWGDERQQMAGLRRAIASESIAQYLPKPMFISALYSMLELDVKSKDYADALSTWTVLKKSETDKGRLAALEPMIDRIEALRSDSRVYEVPSQIAESSWSYKLFKSTFHLVVSEGHISDMKLYCEQRYVSLRFDPELEYRVAPRYGSCTLDLIGEPATRFKLVQY
jgi:protein TonB